jgi:putative membrane protein
MLFAAVVVEFILMRGPLTAGDARRLLVTDLVLGIAASVLLLVGLLRVFHFEKGAYYYFQNWAFIAKLSLFVLVSLLSIVPTREFLAWRRAVKQGQVPEVSPARMQTLRSILHLELLGVALIILFAALMAKGIGVIV